MNADNKKYYKVIDKGSSFFGEVLEYASCSDLDDWTAVILFTEPPAQDLRNSSLFKEFQVQKV